MHPEVEKLVRLQHVDQRIADLTKEIAALPEAEDDARDRVTNQTSNVDKAQKAQQEVDMEIKQLELDVGTRRDTITKLKVQQFETKKNEEFRSMGEEIERYEGEIAQLEDQELELMEESEQKVATLAAERKALAELERDLENDLADIDKRRKNFEAERAQEEETANRLSSDVDNDLLELYKRLFKSKNGSAVVGLTDEVCQGCHMKVTKSTVISAKNEAEVTYCENCGRILYYWTDDSARERDRNSNRY